MPRSFLIKRIEEKMVTGYFPWQDETLMEGCCLKYEMEDEMDRAAFDGKGDSHSGSDSGKTSTSSPSEIQILTPFHSGMSPPTMLVSSCCDKDHGDSGSLSPASSCHHEGSSPFFSRSSSSQDGLGPMSPESNYHRNLLRSTLSAHNYNHMVAGSLSPASSYHQEKEMIPSPSGQHQQKSSDYHVEALSSTKRCGGILPSSGLSYLPPWHVTSSDEIKKHQCEYCLKWFQRSSSLSNHRLIHKNSKSYKCNHCNMSFLRKSDLGKHMVTHSGSKPYQCNVCGKRFSQSSNMLTHQRRHTGIRPYSCGV
uniref:C2H2-type domain-containing protein n=2 Tax=Clytia hemisphaerica TaxID=252671 RepID=A0A7M5V104_9CNID